MTPSHPLHLVTVWNPAYAVDALEAHVSVLLDLAREHRGGRLDADDVYVWWGRIRSPRREGPLPHLTEILALDDQVTSGVPTHLYLTDYRSLYVADVGEVTVDDVRVAEGERERVPEYYERRECDVWFRLWDVRRIVADDTRLVIDELRHLRNVRYHDRPVSLYGGMVELPLIVRRQESTRWFEDRDTLTGGRLWAERDAELRSETGRVSSDLRDNLFGEGIWRAMEPGTRTFLSAAEAVVRARRQDTRFDFSGPAVEYAKAVETELNAVVFGALRPLMAGRPPGERTIHGESGTINLAGAVPHQTLGRLCHLLLKDATVRSGLKDAAPNDAKSLTDEYRIPGRVRRIAELRNPAAHAEAVGREALLEAREEILGIGRPGLLTEVVRMKMRVLAG
ncbi:MAG: hypothetical protein PVI57_00635 [Gemmatimonadota bacterium]|jgi:hypothetical protein